MNHFIKNLYDGLSEEIAVYADLGTLPVRKVTGILASIHVAVLQLKDFIAEHPFASEAEEMVFFKYDKPLFLAEQFYAMEIFTIEAARPLNDAGLLKAFYEQELKYVQRFFEQNKFLYAYFQNDMKELDHLLFVRGKKPADIPVPDSIGLDPLFNTCCDNLFARFIAFEKLQGYLIHCLYEPEDSGQFRIGKKGKVLKWTGNKADLVELAYGIYDSLQINDGDVDIADIIDWLEQSLTISLGRYYQVFSEIKNRKSVSRTRFMDHMQEMLLLHMDQGDGFKPHKPRRVSGSKSPV